MLFISNRLAIAGVVFLALAIVAGLFLITEVVVGETWPPFGWPQHGVGLGGAVVRAAALRQVA